MSQEEQTPFERDLQRSIMVNTKYMPVGYWNLICSIRDVSLWTKGIRINRHWKLKHVKQYFGVKGSALVILSYLEHWKTELDEQLYPHKLNDSHEQE